MAAKTQRIEITLETLLESVDLAEVIVMRIAEAAGFSEVTMLDQPAQPSDAIDPARRVVAA